MALGSVEQCYKRWTQEASLSVIQTVLFIFLLASPTSLLASPIMFLRAALPTILVLCHGEHSRSSSDNHISAYFTSFTPTAALAANPGLLAKRQLGPGSTPDAVCQSER